MKLESFQHSRIKTRKYRMVCPTSYVDNTLFGSYTEAVHVCKSSQYWSPAPQTNKTFCRSFIQSKLHQIIYDTLQSNILHCCSKLKMTRSTYCPLFSPTTAAKQYTRPLMYSPMDQKYWRVIPADNCDNDVDTRDAQYFKRRSLKHLRPVWKP